MKGLLFSDSLNLYTLKRRKEYENTYVFNRNMIDQLKTKINLVDFIIIYGSSCELLNCSVLYYSLSKSLVNHFFNSPACIISANINLIAALNFTIYDNCGRMWIKRKFELSSSKFVLFGQFL